MNNNGAMVALGMVIGGAISSAVTYYFTRKVYLKRSNNEIQAYKDYIKSKQEKTESNDIPVGEAHPEPLRNSSPVDEMHKNLKKIIKDNGYSDAMTVEEAEATGDEELIAAAEAVTKDIFDDLELSSYKPTLINQDIYSGEDEFGYKQTYSHITLDWYAGDSVLCFQDHGEILGVPFEAGDLVENYIRLVGDEWKHHFGDKDYGNDEDCVYVRNSDYKCDFEIIRDPGKYREIVEGIFDEEESDE